MENKKCFITVVFSAVLLLLVCHMFAFSLSSLGSLSETRRQSNLTALRESVTIAVIICTTSRGISPDKLTDMTLFSHLLPSIVQTAETGFKYNIYLVFDVGDIFFDSDERRAEIMAWFAENMKQPLFQHGIASNLSLLSFDNIEKKPGPAFNFGLYVVIRVFYSIISFILLRNSFHFMR